MEIDEPPSHVDEDNGWDADGEEDDDQEDEDISAVVSALLALMVDEPDRE